MTEKLLQELSKLVGQLKHLNRLVIVETDDGNLEKLAQTGIEPPTNINQIVAENLRRLRNESGQSWLIIAGRPEDLDEYFLYELTEEVWKYGQSIVFVTSFGTWETWKARLLNHGFVGLLDCSNMVRLSL